MADDIKLLNESYRKILREGAPAERPPEYYKNQLYVRQTGANRYAGGSFRWLKIRRIEQDSEKEFSVYVYFDGMEKGVTVRLDQPERYLEFKVRSMPATFKTVLMHYFGLSRLPEKWPKELASGWPLTGSGDVDPTFGDLS